MKNITQFIYESKKIMNADNEKKLKFIEKFKIRGTHGENNVRKDLLNGDHVQDVLGDIIDELGANNFNKTDICVAVVGEFAKDQDEWDNFVDTLDSESKEISKTSDDNYILMNHPILDKYVKVDNDNPGFILLFKPE